MLQEQMLIQYYILRLQFVLAYATYTGLSDSKAVSLVSITSAAAFFGRILSGYVIHPDYHFYCYASSIYI